MTISDRNNIAVIDIGKTNAKLVLLSQNFRLITTLQTPNASTLLTRFGVEMLCADTDRLWQFIIEGLTQLNAEFGVDAISITTHGATGALIAGDELALPILDYESPLPETLAADYQAVRPDFAETLSPQLPNGLNLGAQIFWQARRFPDVFKTVTAIVPYAQYWAWRLTGELASEVTSLGCHTDLWNPNAGTFSSLVEAMGWTKLFPPIKPAASVLGGIRGEVAAATGLAATVPVTVGIHDSNASLMPHLGRHDKPVTIISSGTWTIAMTIGGSTAQLDKERDSLANVDAYGRPVPTARFMGGREFDLLVPEIVNPTDDDLAYVLENHIAAYPSFVVGVGPYGKRRGEWSVDASGLTPGQRTAAATLYLALVTQAALRLCGVGESIVIEGPLGRNTLFCQALSRLTGTDVMASGDGTGTSLGAALLSCGYSPQAPLPAAFPPLAVNGFENYTQRWGEIASKI